MSRAQRLLQAVADDIQADLEAYRALRARMNALYEGLLARDSERIEHLNAEIDELVSAADARARRRTKVLAAFGLSEDAAGMERLFAAAGESRAHELRNTWQALGNLAAECHRLNERNGNLLAMHRETLAQVIGAGEAEHLYTPPSY